MSELPAHKGKVLVIDDDEQYLKLTARILRGAGYEVVTRTEVIGTSAAVAAERPCLVLIDLNMPLLDGDRLGPLIQRSMATPPLVILYSGTNDKVLQERARACGANGAIPKGLPPEQFIERLERALLRGAPSVGGRSDTSLKR
jgi:CheY-like chemotaxis protein